MVCVVKLIAKHLPLLALALLVSSTQLRAEESQLPFKVGDVVKLCEPFSTPNQDEQWSLILIVREIKGKWLASEGKDIKGNDGKVYRFNTWFNTDRYRLIMVNEPNELSEYGLIQPIPKPNPNLPRSVIPIPVGDNPKKDASKVEEESK